MDLFRQLALQLDIMLRTVRRSLTIAVVFLLLTCPTPQQIEARDTATTTAQVILDKCCKKRILHVGGMPTPRLVISQEVDYPERGKLRDVDEFQEENYGIFRGCFLASMTLWAQG